jgi:hypothetical protein
VLTPGFYTGVAATALAALALTPGSLAFGGEPSCDSHDLICEGSAHIPPVGGPGRGGPEARRTCASQGKTVPCSTGDGVWLDGHECYIKLASDQPAPPPGKKEGAWYQCTWLPGTVSGIIGRTLWLDQPPAQIDPAQLARELLARIQLARVAIGITPEPGRTGVLGLPTYLWVNNPGAHTLGPISDTATEGGVTVTLTAKVSRVLWNLGDGTTLTCTGAGTPYRDEFGARPSPTCGHTYAHPSTELPGGVYHVSATAVWDVAWTGGGQSGQIPFDVTSETSIRIGEVQALT